MKYYVSEYFESLQGEGMYAGTKALFIRFHFCNLTCCWCDTKYTWLKKSGTYEEFTKQQLINHIQNANCIHVVFTGGEPALYKLDELVCEGKEYHVESNGMFLPDEPLDVMLSDGTNLKRGPMKEDIIKHFNWIISPKLSNSGQETDNAFLEYWKAKEYCIFKFIIRDNRDLQEVNDTVNKYGILKNRVYVGLEGTTIESQLRPEMVDIILYNGFNYSPRLQILLWGSERGK